MALDCLDTPLRVTWELATADGPIPAATAALVAERVVEAGIFFLTLEERPLAHPHLVELLTILAAGAVQVGAVFSGSAAEWHGLASHPPLGTLLLDVGACLEQSRGELPLLRDWVARLRSHGYEPAWLLVPQRRWLALLPQLFALARKLGVGRFKLPNTRIDASVCRSGREELLGPEDVAALRRILGTEPQQQRRDLQLEVHDLFLWELLFPGEREAGRAEYGGCQAANSLAHIAADATVYPCSSWPVPLGSLLDASFAELWQSPQREHIRALIAAPPPGCAGCRDLSRCLGGCRGLAEVLGTTTAGRDLLCAGVRR